ncbi:MAG: metallophosphoesterase [Candidatus Lokiarchaeota archaeon]|nr:metallophosphoesterase [Candidatus Lokiarchaeota archaeon]
MVNIIQISDLHYGSEFVPECMENIISYIKDSKPDVVICTGDIVHKGRVVQYKEVLPYFTRIKEITNLLAVPGNHDAKNSGIIFFERLLGPRRSRLLLEDKDAIIVGVCSAKDDIASGEIGDEQLDWLARQFNKSLEDRVIALHHHLIPIPMSGQKFTTVRDAGEIIEFTNLFEIDLVLMGHRHVPHAYTISWKNSSSTTFLYCGTSTSKKVRADDSPSFNHIFLNEGDLEVYIVNSTNLEKSLLVERKEHHTEFIRPRKTRIEHLLASAVWDE